MTNIAIRRPKPLLGLSAGHVSARLAERGSGEFHGGGIAAAVVGRHRPAGLADRHRYGPGLQQATETPLAPDSSLWHSVAATSEADVAGHDLPRGRECPGASGSSRLIKASLIMMNL
jgi:hypothetical protein